MLVTVDVECERAAVVGSHHVIPMVQQQRGAAGRASVVRFDHREQAASVQVQAVIVVSPDNDLVAVLDSSGPHPGGEAKGGLVQNVGIRDGDIVGVALGIGAVKGDGLTDLPLDGKAALGTPASGARPVVTLFRIVDKLGRGAGFVQVHLENRRGAVEVPNFTGRQRAAEDV